MEPNLMNRIFSFMGMTALALVAGPVLLAQTATTGALNGVVTDNSGAVVAGATVTFKGSQVSRTAVTGVNGHFSAGLLNGGVWQVTVAKPGYATLKHTLTLLINNATTVNFKIAKAGSTAEEALASPSTLDAFNTTSGSNLAMADLDSVPKGRNINELALLAPGVTGSGFGTGASKGLGLDLAVAGGSGADNVFSIDGLKTNDMRYGGQGMAMTTEFIDQMDVQTGGFKPETSATGGAINVLTKSGSNEFGGSSWVSLSPSALSPAPKQTPFMKEVPAATVYEVGTWVGGAIIKDKFFYSVGLEYEMSNSPSYSNLSNLSVGGTRTPNVQFLGKLQYYLSPEDLFTLSSFGNNQTATLDGGAYPGNLTDGRGSADIANKTVNNSSHVNLAWDHSLNADMTLSLRAGRSHNLGQVTPSDTAAQVVDSTYYSAGGPGYGTAKPLTRYVTGGGPDSDKETSTTTQFSGDFNWVHGTHTLKVGYSHTKSYFTEEDVSNSTWMLYNVAAATGVRNPGLQATLTSHASDSQANAIFQAFYIQDIWQATRDLNFFYGIRAEDQEQKGANGTTLVRFKFTDNIQPRLGFTWDVAGDSRSKLSGSYAAYTGQIPQRMAAYGQEASSLAAYGGGDPATTNASTAAYNRATGAVSTTGAPYRSLSYPMSWGNATVAEGIKLPKRAEFQLGFDRQVSDSTTLGVHGRYRKLTDPIVDSMITNYYGRSIDPSDPNGLNFSGTARSVLWNPSAGAASWISPFTGQKVYSSTTLFPNADSEYKSLDFTCAYKGESTYLYFSYTLSSNSGGYEGPFSPTSVQPGGVNASYAYWPYAGTGPLSTDHTQVFKFFGSKKFNLHNGTFTTGFNVMAQTGMPISKLDNGSSTPGLMAANPYPAAKGLTIGDPGGYGDATYNDGKMGNFGRTPFQAKVDLTFKYERVFSGKLRLEPFLEIYNVLNARPVIQVDEQATDSAGHALPAGQWGSATVFQAGRSLRLGAKLRF
jgi:hypothetical protein